MHRIRGARNKLAILKLTKSLCSLPNKVLEVLNKKIEICFALSRFLVNAQS